MTGMTRRAFTGAVTTLLAAPAVIASPNSWSDLDLILGADISPSVSAERYQRQHIGYAEALRNPDNMSAILASGHVHSCFFQFAGEAVPRLPMRHLNSEEAVLTYAAEIEGLARPAPIIQSRASQAMFYGLNILRTRHDQSGITAIRTKLDISSDGETGIYPSFRELSGACSRLKLDAENEGMQINALIMRPDEDEADSLSAQEIFTRTNTFYANHVITDRSVSIPTDGFIKPAPEIDDFIPAMTEKIAVEVMM